MLRWQSIGVSPTYPVRATRRARESFNWGSSLFKAVHLLAKAQFQLRFDALNAFKHKQLSAVSNTFTLGACANRLLNVT
jgi:hypothetical protein